MADSNFMDVLNTRNDLLEKLAGVLLLESFSLHNVVEKLASTGKFHDQEQLPSGLNDLKVQLDESAYFI